MMELTDGRFRTVIESTGGVRSAVDTGAAAAGGGAVATAGR